MKSVPFIVRLLSHAAAATERAGCTIRDILSKGDLKVVVKGVNDLQTEADRQAQRTIISEIRASFPKDRITMIAEEDIPEAEAASEVSTLPIAQEVLRTFESQECPSTLVDIKPSDVILWIDPLDGTSEFTQGLLDHVTVLVGISVRGQAVAGVVHQPYYGYDVTPEDGSKPVLGRTAWGMIGAGVYGIKTQKAPPRSDKIIVTTRSHSDGLVEQALKGYDPCTVKRVGGCGHKVMLVLEGLAHAYVFASHGCKKWDTCAPEALLHASGGRLTDITGQYIRYLTNEPRGNLTGVLATSENHQWYLDRIPPNVRKHFQSVTAHNRRGASASHDKAQNPPSSGAAADQEESSPPKKE